VKGRRLPRYSGGSQTSHSRIASRGRCLGCAEMPVTEISLQGASLMHDDCGTASRQRRASSCDVAGHVKKKMPLSQTQKQCHVKQIGSS
jgi:hypothetical protein